MIKRSSSRNHRSKGIKVKHVLQIILLLGVCFWLIYQVKHSHDKKKEFDESDAKVSARTQTTDQIPKLGRKDLHPGKDKVKHEEEEADENIVEDEGNKHEQDEQEEETNMHETEENEDSKHEVREQGEEETKHGAEEHEDDENRSEEIENEGRGGDDEIDDNDQEKIEVDTDPDEEFMDEEKEKEEEGDEKGNENSEDEEKGGSVENHNTHEAREENYKGDDASSAVTQDTHTTITETETVSLEDSDPNSEMSVTKAENKPNYTEESNGDQNDSDFKITEAELAVGTSSNATSDKDTRNNSLSIPVDTSHLNKTANTDSDGHLGASSSLTVMITKTSNNLTASGTGTNTSSFSEHNKMVISSESNQAQNNMVNTTEGLEEGGNRVSEDHLPDSKSPVTVKTENGDGAVGQASNIESGESENSSRNSDRKEEGIDASDDEKSKVNTGTSETNKTQNSSYTKENTDATEDEKLKSGDTQTDEMSSDSSSAHGTLDSVEHDATDSSESHILKDVTEVRTDLGTLPDIRNEADNGDDAAAE